MAELLLPPTQADCVRRILWAHLPSGTRVSVIGSRATGQGLKPHSDLDLLIDSPVELPLMTLADIRESFAESDLPFSVDLLERRDASAEFLAQLEQEGLLELSPLPAEHA
jgi:predicted nucleotidyltransferase